MNIMHLRIVGLSFASLLLLSACGSDTPTPGATTASGCSLVSAQTVTISSTGVSPKIACLLVGGSVTFSNTDAVAHTIAADNAAACPLLDVGAIAAATTRTVPFPATLLGCGYHDAASPSNTAFQGSVSVAAAGTPGY
jgi:plastocyanin